MMIAIMSILTVIVPLIALPLVLLLLLLEKRHNNKKIYCIIFSVIIAIIMYNFIPNKTMDLYRYYLLMDNYKFIDLSTFISKIINNIEPLMYFIFWLFSKTNDNHLIMFFVTVVSYLIQIYIIFDYQKEKQLDNKQFNIVLIYFLSTFLIIYYISGIRFCLGRLLFFLALYYDLYKNKKSIGYKSLYIIPLFIHQSIIVLLLLRILLYINKYKFDFKIIFIFILILLVPNIIFSFIDFISSNFSAFGFLSQRTYSYFNMGFDSSNIYLLQFALMFFMIFVCIYIKIYRIETNKRMYNYSLLCLITCLLFINNPTISSRFISVCSTFFVLFYIDLFKNIPSKKLLIYDIILIIISAFYIAFQIIQIRLGVLININNVPPKIFVLSLLYIMICIIFIKGKSQKGLLNEKKSNFNNYSSL